MKEVFNTRLEECLRMHVLELSQICLRSVPTVFSFYFLRLRRLWNCCHSALRALMLVSFSEWFFIFNRNPFGLVLVWTLGPLMLLALDGFRARGGLDRVVHPVEIVRSLSLLLRHRFSPRRTWPVIGPFSLFILVPWWMSMRICFLWLWIWVILERFIAIMMLALVQDLASSRLLHLHWILLLLHLPRAIRWHFPSLSRSPKHKSRLTFLELLFD